jgi:uncharacterized membrane protein YfcA
LLIGVLGFAALHAVIVNRALSLVVVLTALPARLVSVPSEDVAPHWPVVLNLLAGSLAGAWLGHPDSRAAVRDRHKVAGCLSLAVSLPTMLVAFARYSRDASFQVLAASRGCLVAMAAGSVTGAVGGGLLLSVVPKVVLVPLLALLLVASSVKVWQHGRSLPLAHHDEHRDGP